jgi:4'-phosphopantetheinyl transferase
MTDEVQVWIAGLDVADARYQDLLRTLSPEEHRRAEDLPASVARKFIVARGLLRELLSGFTGTPPQKLRFQYGDAGKPSLTDHEINFNVSHSADLALFAFAPDRQVGVDVENERPVRRLLDVAQRFMTEEEVQSLAATSPEDRDATFLRSWVTREARLKAQGKGVWSGAERPGQNLTHKLFSPRPGYIAAVAAVDSDWRLYTCAVKN